MNKIQHMAERKAFETVLRKIVRKGKNESASEMAESILKIMKGIMGDSWKEDSYAIFQEIADNPDSKWARYVDRLISEADPDIITTFLTNAAYEGGFRGFKTTEEMAEKYDCNVPWLILMDPTSACNLHCIGCWAAEYGHKQNLSYEVMDRTISEAKELGTHAVLFTGGEPLVRKKDIIRLCENHPDVAFHAFTNGTLIDEQFCEDLLRVKNFMVSLSLEGFEESTDSRRGQGTYEKVIKAMDLMHSYHIPYGLSICYTANNYKDVTSDEFLDMIIEKGCYFAWYFHYMPVGMNAGPELLLTPEQRMYVLNRIREIRGMEGGKEIFAIDFQNDGEFVTGCVAGGKRYLHINAAGDVEPCVFIHYSSANINEKSFLECLQQPLFKAYREKMPFNNNYLRPCPMLENPQFIREMVNSTGARSTDLEAPESVEHLTEKTEPYAEAWKPYAEKYWNEHYPSGHKEDYD